LSRSSALASKATGYPLAFIATKLSLGASLTEVKNIITKETSSCFEPALDYVVLKFPRWDLQKFQNVSFNIGSEMKSVGEVMAIGRTFEEALQKAIRMLDVGMNGLVCNELSFKNLKKELKEPTDKRLIAIAEAFKCGFTIEEIYKLTNVNPWFLFKINNIVQIEKQIRKYSVTTLPSYLLRNAKQKGFSDDQIAILIKSTSSTIREYRKKLFRHR